MTAGQRVFRLGKWGVYEEVTPVGSLTPGQRNTATISGLTFTEEGERDRAPHCDMRILHAPGQCWACDPHPDWQRGRIVQCIAFTGSPEELGTDDMAPCPSTYFRSPEIRDRWPGNVAG